MIPPVAYCFAALSVIGLLMHNAICKVKGQSTSQNYENGNTSKSPPSELNAEAIRNLNEQMQSMRDLLTESVQEMKNLKASFQELKNKQDTVASSLQAIEGRSEKQIQSIYALFNASFLQINTQHETIMTDLKVTNRHLVEHDICMNNQTKNLWKLGIGKVKLLSNIGNHSMEDTCT